MTAWESKIHVWESVRNESKTKVSDHIFPISWPWFRPELFFFFFLYLFYRILLFLILCFTLFGFIKEYIWFCSCYCCLLLVFLCDTLLSRFIWSAVYFFFFFMCIENLFVRIIKKGFRGDYAYIECDKNVLETGK